MGTVNKPDPSKYTDKYGAVNTTQWQADINQLPGKKVWYETVEDTRRGGTKQVRRTSDERAAEQKRFNTWQEENKYKQQTLNQQIMSGAAQNENIASTSTNELDTSQSDSVDTAVTSSGKKKKTQGSLSTSLGL